MDPLMVARYIGELVNAILVDRIPLSQECLCSELLFEVLEHLLGHKALKHCFLFRLTVFKRVEAGNPGII